MTNKLFGLLLILACLPLIGQTVYLRSSSPASVSVTGATNATPVVVTTSAAHGLNAGDTVGIWGTCSNGGASPITGFRKVMASPAPTSTTFAISDLAGTPIAANGAWCDGSTVNWPASAQWVGKVTAYTLGAQPLGWLDGPTGNLTRKLSLGPLNGLTSVTTTGCPAACVIAVVTSFDPTAMTPPVAAGSRFSAWGTGTSLDTSGSGGGVGSPYTVATVNSSGWTSAPFAASISNTGYTNINLHCGPAATPNDTIGGTQSCTRISLLYYVGNPAYDALITQSGGFFMDDASDKYKFAFDAPGVGTLAPGWAQFDYFQIAAFRFYVDQSNALLFRDLNYYFTHLERIGGVSIPMNELFSTGGNLDFGQGGVYEAMAGVGPVYFAYSPYASSANKTAFLNKVYNNVDDPSNLCSKQGVEMSGSTGINTVVNSGTAQATSSTSITLASGASASDNFYAGLVVVAGATAPSTGSYATITGYTGSSQIATFSAWSAGTPASNTQYTIFATATWSTLTANAPATVTGTKTTFTTSTHVGDAIVGMNNWNQADVTQYLCYVTAITNDTTLTCVNSDAVGTNASTTVPTAVWNFPAMTSTNCGLVWGLMHSNGLSAGSQPLIYPPNGRTEKVGNSIVVGGNQVTGITYTRLGMDFAAAPDDSRAVRDLGMVQNFWFDYSLAHYMTYGTGWVHQGSDYAPGVMAFTGWDVWMIAQSIPTFPSMGLTGKWLSDQPLYGMYTALPDVQDIGDGNGHIVSPVKWGSESGSPRLESRSLSAGTYSTFAPLLFSPTSTLSAYYKNWLATIQAFPISGSAGTAGVFLPQSSLFLDPRIPSSDYTAQPHQILLGATNASICTSLTGAACPANLNGLAFISRTGLGGWATNATNTFVKFEARGFAADHDNPSPGTSLYKVGPLLDADSDSGATGAEPFGSDLSNVGMAIEYGGLQVAWSHQFRNAQYVNPFDFGTTQFLRWASANHGSWDASYGDQASNYAYGCADVAGLYLPTFGVTYAQECVVDFKKSGNDQFVFNLAATETSVSQTIAKHVHYPQNGEATESAYPEGNTSCPGSSGCPGLNTDRLIKSIEDGGNDGRNPIRNYGIMTKILSPGTVTVNWDCPGGVECTASPLSTYTGGFGHSDRVSICAGSSCSANVNKFETLIVHKVMQGLTDATLTTTALNPDVNWTGAQVCGATSCAVFMGALGGTTHSTMMGFTTTHSGTAQYLFGGLTPGTYAVTVGGSAVAGSPFTVGAGDNSLYFESAAGTVSVNGSGGSRVLALSPSSLSYSCVSGGSSPAAQTVGVSAVNVVLDNWSAAKAQSWLTLSPASGNAAGSITASVNCAGQPAGTQTDTITVSSTTTGITNSPQTAAVSLTVSAGVSSMISGKTTASGNVTAH